MKKYSVLIFILFTAFVFSQQSIISLNEAKTQALKESKNIILIFSGSDWCAPCIKLDRSIFQSDEFKKAAEENWIVIRADFPKKKANTLSPEQKEVNNKLAEKYNPEGNFPKVLVLDTKGIVLGIMGYEKVTSEVYIQKLKKFHK
ncbi:thioredoxin family protein [uncultured Flavobacterium sp.]|uniref:thioredoxin family protein n=1 Tax=uncultured Flavobacterium sp. TaxID=165435 RepID=UPI0030CA28B5